MIGTITRWNARRRYGFVQVTGRARPVFVHGSECPEPLNDGTLVEFTVAPTKTGERATRVRRLAECPKCSAPLSALTCARCGFHAAAEWPEQVDG